MPSITALLVADGGDTFVSRPVDTLDLVQGGIDGDRHFGLTRGADARTPWHKRGTLIANTRQLSLVSVEEMARVADLLEIEAVDPALVGANIVVEGIADLTTIRPSTRLQAPSGATIFITELNKPCRQPGRTLAAAHGRPDLELAFPERAKGLRGVVAVVEREGTLRVGDALKLIPAR